MADFFLEPDDAKTFGDIDYMRKAKRVKRTFPKTLSQPEEQERDIQVSATVFRDEQAKMRPPSGTPAASDENVNGITFAASSFDPSNFGAPTGTSSSTSSFETKPDEATQRRKADSSMDMFRNMAKQIKK